MDFSSFLDEPTSAPAPEFIVNDKDDWALTLLNVEKLVQIAREARSKQMAAEERAKAAEQKAADAIHWLRRLHEAER